MLWQGLAGQAVHVLDRFHRFHVMKKFNEAIDQVRRDEVRRLEEQGLEPVLWHTRWCLLKRPENLTATQATRLQDLLTYSAERFLKNWCMRALRSRLAPYK